MNLWKGSRGQIHSSSAGTARLPGSPFFFSSLLSPSRSVFTENNAGPGSAADLLLEVPLHVAGVEESDELSLGAVQEQRDYFSQVADELAHWDDVLRGRRRRAIRHGLAGCVYLRVHGALAPLRPSELVGSHGQLRRAAHPNGVRGKKNWRRRKKKTFLFYGEPLCSRERDSSMLKSSWLRDVAICFAPKFFLRVTHRACDAQSKRPRS
jgi:hypothetical protein